MSIHTVLVCLPGTPEHLPTNTRHPDRNATVQAATAALAMRGIIADGVMPHFTPRRADGLRGMLLSPLRTRRLIDTWQDTTAGGPIRLLDLTGMRLRAQAQAATQWLVWQQAVAGTRPAQPFWVFAERYRDDPERYPLRKAQQQYRDQPRVQAMTAFNALPNRPCDLPTACLEAFQAGQHTFALLAWLTAVPADGLATTTLSVHGGWLTPASGRLEDQLAYLRDANAYLERLPHDTTVVAMATTT
jgi:hypothetical protein